MDLIGRDAQFATTSFKALSSSPGKLHKQKDVEFYLSQRSEWERAKLFAIFPEGGNGQHPELQHRSL
jgi:hypothetical protein